MRAETSAPRSVLDSLKAGIVAGQAASWTIVGLFLSIDWTVAIQPGALYMVIGMLFGQESWPAIYTGFLLHMITGTVIGIIYMLISNSVKYLRITGIFKGLGTGILTGVVVWSVLFLPVHFGFIIPMLNDIVINGEESSSTVQMAQRLLAVSSVVIYGSLSLHVVFGGVLGAMGRLVTSGDDMRVSAETGTSNTAPGG
ncbi:MAG: hypothetical protein ACREAQ_06000 [Nitrososphaera sp.]